MLFIDNVSFSSSLLLHGFHGPAFTGGSLVWSVGSFTSGSTFGLSDLGFGSASFADMMIAGLIHRCVHGLGSLFFEVIMKFDSTLFTSAVSRRVFLSLSSSEIRQAS